MPREYFSHDYHSRSDEKIKRLIRKWGYEGYGIYWALIEDLYCNTNVLRLEYDGITKDFQVEKEMIISIINDFDLFEIDGEYFSSKSVERRLTEREEKSIKARESINKRWEKNKNTNVLRTNNTTKNDRNTNKEKKSIYKESIINNTKESFDPLEIEKKIAENEFELMNSHSWIEQAGMQYGLDAQQTADRLAEWISEMKLKEMMARPLKELKSHFINTLRLYQKQQKNGNRKQTFAEYASEILRGPH